MENTPRRPGKEWITREFEAQNGRRFEVRVGKITGARPGPVFTNIAGQHGMEHMGPIVLRDFFDEVDPATLAGDLYVCPCANPLAVEMDFEFYPDGVDDEVIQGLRGGDLKEQERYFGHTNRDHQGAWNMNRVWRPWRPADEPPSGLAEQIADWLWQVSVEPADVVMDHHGLQALKPLVYADKEVLPWMPFLGVESVWCLGPLPQPTTAYLNRKLSQQACAAGKVGLLLEFSSQHDIKEHERSIGRRALFNIMKVMGMVGGEPEVPCDVWLLPSTGEHWRHGFQEMKATHRGHPHFYVEENQPMRQGDVLATIRDVQTHTVLETITAPADGLMLYRTRKPLTEPGVMVCGYHTDATLLARAGENCRVPRLPSRASTVT